MNRVAPASLPAYYEQPRANIGQRTADPNCRWPQVSNPAHSIPGASAVRWQPPHSCGGGALQRSEKTSPLRMRFSAGQFEASPSGSSTRKPGHSNLINCNSPATSNRAQSNRLPNAPFLNVKISKNLYKPLRKVFRLETTPILCFHRLTTNFNRTLVSVRNSKLGSVIKLDSFQRIQIELENTRPAASLAAVGARLAAPAPTKPLRNVRHCRGVNQSHG